MNQNTLEWSDVPDEVTADCRCGHEHGPAQTALVDGVVGYMQNVLTVEAMTDDRPDFPGVAIHVDSPRILLTDEQAKRVATALVDAVVARNDRQKLLEEGAIE